MAAQSSGDELSPGWRALAQNDRIAQDRARSRAKEVFAECCIIVAVTGLLLVLVEIASFFALRFLKAMTRPVYLRESILAAYQGEPWAPQLARETVGPKQLEYKPFVAWQHRPYSGKTIVVESDGWRRTFYSQCVANSFTVWMFGGSTMWGVGSPDWGTIPSCLAELYARAGRPACVRNLGEGGWNSTQEAIALMLELKRAARKPDLVIFYDGANDTFVPYQEGRVDVHVSSDEFQKEIAREHALEGGGFHYWRFLNTTLLIFFLKGRLTPPTPPPSFAHADVDALAHATTTNYFENFELVDALASHYGFQYASFWQPSSLTGRKALTAEEQVFRQPGFAGAPPETWCRKIYKIMRAEKRPHFYDFSDIFDNIQERIYLDWCHVTVKGNQIIARRMYETLAGMEAAGQGRVPQGSGNRHLSARGKNAPPASK